LNGRISARSFSRYRLIRPLVAYLVSQFRLLLMRTQADADRIISLGARPESVRVAGNTKFDNLPEAMPQTSRLDLRARLGIGGNRNVVTLGSAREGEAGIVLDALKPVGGAVPLLVVAPRHMADVAGFREACISRGLIYREIEDVDEPGDFDGEPDVLLVAQMGRLLEIYSISDVAVVGGTLMPWGGHNPLEPASQGIATVVGPHTENITDDVQYMRSRGCVFLAEEAGLGPVLCRVLSERRTRESAGRAAVEAVLDRRGIAARSVEMMAQAGLLPC
jgi:3-deoxy-D-manno-octulosonic-acid transferase